MASHFVAWCSGFGTGGFARFLECVLRSAGGVALVRAHRLSLLFSEVRWQAVGIPIDARVFMAG